MTTLRDNQLALRGQFARKKDNPYLEIAVLTDQFGNQSSARPLRDVWFDQGTKLVWAQAAGAATPSPIRCVRIPRPQVGLVVLIGKPDGSVETEVLQDASYLRFTNVGNQDWVETDPDNLAPGGRQMAWIYSKQISPLATYPGTGLTISVVEGDYVCSGERKTFEGVTNWPLTQNPTVGEHYYAGLYLDSANAFNVVYGASVSTGETPPDPAWPVGAFQLATVLIDDVQTSIDFETDITDRRMIFYDENAGGGAWPAPGKIKIGTTAYNTLTDAAAAASSGDLIKVGEGQGLTFVGSSVSIPDGVYLSGSGPTVTMVATTDIGSPSLRFLGYSELQNIQVYHTLSGTSGVSILADGGIEMTNVIAYDTIQLNNYAMLRGCEIENLTVGAAGDVEIRGGQVANITVTAGGVLGLYGVRVAGTITGAIKDGSYYTESGGRQKASYHRHFQMMGA